MRKISKSLFCTLNSSISLLIGLFIYCFFRQNTYFHTLIGKIGISFPYVKLPDLIPFDFIKYYLPDFLWLYSLTFCLFLIFSPTLNKGRIIALFSFLMSVIFELLQQESVISGTADIVDVLAYFTASVLAYAVFKKYIINKERTK